MYLTKDSFGIYKKLQMDTTKTKQFLNWQNYNCFKKRISKWLPSIRFSTLLIRTMQLKSQWYHYAHTKMKKDWQLDLLKGKRRSLTFTHFKELTVFISTTTVESCMITSPKSKHWLPNYTSGNILKKRVHISAKRYK